MSFRPLLLLVLSAAPAVFAQTAVRLTAQTPAGFVTVADGSTIPVQSSGRETNILFSVTNGGASTVTISQIAVTGSEFTITSAPGLPSALTPGASLFFNVRYTPVLGRTSTASGAVQYTESNIARQISFTLAGAAPDYVFAVTAPDGRRSTITPGSQINFGSVRPGAPVTWIVSVTNRGSGTGTLSSAAVSGRDFSTTFSGTQPIPAGQEVPVPVVFNPQTRGATSGTLTLDLGVGAVTFGLTGTGAAPDYIFAYALRTDGNARPLADGGRLTFSATPATTSAIADVVVTNQGNGPGSVRSVALEGAAFQLNGLPLVPASIEPGTLFRFSVQFTPPRLGSYTGTLRIETDERTLNVIVEGTTAEPAFSLSYVDPQSRNTLPVPNQGTLAFLPTAVDASTVFTMIVQNTGAGTGFVNSVSVQGDAFALVELPSLPATVLASRDLRFGLRFNPKQRQSHTGALQIETTTGILSVRLTGEGISAALSVEAAEPDADFHPVAPGSELVFSAAVGQNSTKTVRVMNTGNSDAQIANISVTGAGFQLANVPFLPLTLAVGDSQIFTVVFAPPQPGVSRGRLRIGDQFFDVAGTGLAPRLEYSYTNDAGTTSVAESGAVILAPSRVGESSRIDFAMQNTGTSPVVISTIGITPANSQFSVEGLPPLPLSMEPGRRVGFGIRFTPNNVGAQTATLRVNNTGFTLSGNAQPPVPLPPYRIEGPSGAQQPLQQPAVGVTLGSPYTLPLRGTLTLSFLSDVFAENPAVQFSSGGRVAAFTIPAGATQAVFDNGATEVRLQTGTVAGTIQLRPAFSTQAGLDLTPPEGQGLAMTIARAAPQLLSAEIASRTPNAVLLIITGYSTTRTLRQMRITLTPRPGEQLTTSEVTTSVESSALVWFQSTASQGFGGLFSLQMPLTFQRGDSQEDLVSRIQSFGVTISNELGVSNGVTVAP